MMTLLQDEDIQRKGIVPVGFNLNKSAIQQVFDLMQREYFSMRMSIPDRVVGVHYCYNDPSLRNYIAGLRLMSTKQERQRFRSHIGNENGTIFQLRTYGIDTSLLPMMYRTDGSISNSWHREWMRIQRGKEQLSAELSASLLSSPCLVPRRFDVLFGRSRQCRDHTGNLRAGHLVDMHFQQYDAANRFEKMEIADRIVSMVHQSYGRFLKWDTKMGWVQVDCDTARLKISHFFRQRRTKSSSKNETTTSKTRRDSLSSSSSEPIQDKNSNNDTICNKEAESVSVSQRRVTLDDIDDSPAAKKVRTGTLSTTVP